MFKQVGVHLVLDSLKAHPVNGTERSVAHDGAAQTAIECRNPSLCAVDSAHQPPYALRLRRRGCCCCCDTATATYTAPAYTAPASTVSSEDPSADQLQGRQHCDHERASNSSRQARHSPQQHTVSATALFRQMGQIAFDIFI
jgi:hypothetical protein